MEIAGRIDITPAQRQSLLSLLSSYIPDTAVWAYGSRVKGTSRHASDLDLVIFATHEQRECVAALKEALEESDLPFRVDVMVWDEVPENFRKNILEQFVVLIEKASLPPQ